MSCADSCIWMGDGETGEFSRTSRPKARKQHQCCECGDTIRVGQQHEYAVGKWDGIMDHYRTCDPCVEIRNTFCCDGYAFTCLWEEIADQMFREWNEMKAIDCLARLKTTAAVDKMRAMYRRYRRHRDGRKLRRRAS